MNSTLGARATSEIDIAVGQRLQQLRRSADLSQKVVAKQLGISFQQLQKYEKGVNRISAGRLWELAQLFGVTPNHFYECVMTSASKPLYLTPHST